VGSEKLKTKNYKPLEILVFVSDFRARSGSENQKLRVFLVFETDKKLARSGNQKLKTKNFFRVSCLLYHAYQKL